MPPNTFCALKSKGNITLFLLVIIVFLMVLTSLLAIKLFGGQKTTEPVAQGPSPFAQPETSIPKESTPNTKDVLIYEKDAKLYKLDKDHNSTEIAKYEGGVYHSFSYDTGMQYVAFLAGEVEELNGFINIWPTKVYLHNLKTDTTLKIYELDLPRSECGDGVKGVKVSADGKFTAITTRNRLVLFNNIEGAMVKAYDLPVGTQFLCAYFGKAFSPDNEKMLLQIGFYEGGGNSILDFSTGKITETNFSNYVFGKTAHGWVDNDTIVYSESTEAPQSKPYLVTKTDIYTSPFANLNASQKIGDTIDGSIYPVAVHAGALVYGNMVSDEIGKQIKGHILKTHLGTGSTSVVHDFTNEGVSVYSLRITSNNDLYVTAIPLDNSTQGKADLYLLGNQFEKIPNTLGAELGR